MIDSPSTNGRSWCTSPRPSLTGSAIGSLAVTPQTRTSAPGSGREKPPRKRTRAGLPAPFWPSSASPSPLRTQSVASLRTVTPPNFFETCRSSSASVPSLPGPGCWPASGMQDPGHGPETVDGTGQDDGRGRRGLPLLKIVLDLRGRPDEADRLHHGGRDGGRCLMVPACQGQVA